MGFQYLKNDMGHFVCPNCGITKERQNTMHYHMKRCTGNGHKCAHCDSEFIQQHSSSIVFNEAAILIETGAYKLFDQLVLVTAPDELKIKRVIEREQCSRESVIDRMEKQWTDAAKKDIADFVLINDEESLLIPQIETLIQALKTIH